MVRAILAGTKTQTRRSLNVKDRYFGCFTGDCPHDTQADCNQAIAQFAQFGSPYGKPGDRLWVRETFAAPWGLDYKFPGGESGILYRSDNPKKFPDDGTWKPSIFMPRAASRITLEIVIVRVERLHDITEADAESEGAPRRHDVLHESFQSAMSNVAVRNYAVLWDRINGKGSWAVNPWVWVIEFKKISGMSPG